MSDIVDRLQKWSIIGYGHDASLDMKEAAAEIKRLRAALDEAQQAFASESYNVSQLRAALGNADACIVCGQTEQARKVIRAALEVK